MVADTIDTSAILLRNANETEGINKMLRKQLKTEQTKYTRDMEKLKQDG